MSEDPSQMPYSDSNYCQIHMTTVSEGLYQKLTEKDVQFGLLDMKEQALLDFRMTNEADALFGVKQQIVDPISRKVKYMSDGMLRKIDKRLDMGAESKITNDLIYGWASDIFCGNTAANAASCSMAKTSAARSRGPLPSSNSSKPVIPRSCSVSHSTVSPRPMESC